MAQLTQIEVNGVTYDIADLISGFVTTSVNNLANYYLKSDTYTRAEVQQLIAAIQGVSFVSVATLPTASADTMGGKIYLVPSSNPKTQNVKDEYITIESNGSYSWEKIGSTEMSLDGYVTDAELNAALSDYTNTADLTALLSGKVDKETGKGLSTNDYTDAEKAKLGGIAAGAQANVLETIKVNGTPQTPVDKAVDIDTKRQLVLKGIPAPGEYDTTTFERNYCSMADLSKAARGEYGAARYSYFSGNSSSSEVYPVAGKSETVFTVKEKTVYLLMGASARRIYHSGSGNVVVTNTPIPTVLSQLSEDTTHRVVTDAEKDAWNGKYTKPGSGIPASDMEAGAIPDVTGKADKVSSPTSGNFAGLDANGNLTDSGKKASDFQPTIDNNHKLDYGLLSNTPTIPDAQIQSDWNQSDNTKKDYIKNKPNIPAAQVNSDWNANSGVAQILNKPSIPDAVEANPTVPSGTTPSDLTGLKVGSNYYGIPSPTVDNTPTKNSANLVKSGGVYDAINPPIVTAQPAGGFAPNVVYDLGTLTGTVTFALAAATDATIPNAYHWTFDTGSTAPTITWPSGIIWPDGFTPSVDASKHYEVLVRNGYASMLSYSLS